MRLASITKHWKNLQVTLEDIGGEAFLVDLGVIGSNIVVTRNARRERQRFSLAHELGHLALAEHGVPIAESLRTARDKQVERWCDQFASHLLMPEAWIQQEINGSSLHDLYASLDGLAAKYQVSFEAFAIRITEVTSVNVLWVKIHSGRSSVRKSFSKQEPLFSKQYTRAVLHAIKRGSPATDLDLAPSVRCIVRARRRSAEKEDWIALLSNVDSGLTIKCSRRSKLRG